MPEQDDGDFNLQEVVANLIKRSGGDASSALGMLVEENYNLRSSRRTLREKNAELAAAVTTLKEKAQGKEGHKMVSEDAVVLEGDDLKAWQSFKGLGSFDEVKSKLDKMEGLEQKVSQHEKKERNDEVASIMGWNPKVLLRLGSDLEYKVQKDEKQETVLVKNEDKFVPLADYAKSQWTEFLPSLAVEQQKGVPVLKQTPAGLGPRIVSDDEVAKDQAERVTIDL